VFVGLWFSDRTVIRRLRGLAAIDPDVEQGIQARDERRRHGLQVILGRVRERYGHPDSERQHELVDVLHILTRFETFDALTRDGRSAAETEAILNNTVLRTMGVPIKP
jgi:hypothetical protein